MPKSLCVFSRLLFFWLCLALPAQAVVNLSATRVVFEKGAATQSITLANSADYPVMVQAWIDDGDPHGIPQTAESPFVVLPPIFRLAPLEQRSVRLLTSAKGLPDDRESLFWLNIYEIPPNQPAVQNEKILLAFRTQLKVFWRPAGVGKLTEDVGNQLRFTRSGEGVTVSNPTPWNISLAEVEIAGYSASGMTLSPFSQQPLFTFNKVDLQDGVVKFVIINDEGNQWGYALSIK
ncbi:fimbrial biogenesis chaperone [Buttiauxella agrestis]|uniref:fimbrial biogenesis chaperone n=1 Tax=Buttiauxella agrestis TaxID=82977 RepID=UPI0039755E8D